MPCWFPTSQQSGQSFSFIIPPISLPPSDEYQAAGALYPTVHQRPPRADISGNQKGPLFHVSRRKGSPAAQNRPLPALYSPRPMATSAPEFAGAS